MLLTLTAASAVAAALVAVLTLRLFKLRRRTRQLKRELGELRAAHHYRRQLQTAADWAIAAGLTGEPGLEHLRVTVADVQQRMRDDFNRTVPRADAAAVLRRRLEVQRSALGAGIVTDAYENPGT